MDKTQKKPTFNPLTTNILLYMVFEGVLDEIERHFNEGNDVTLSDYDDRTALHIAASEGHYDMVEFLVKNCGVNIYATDRWDHTALDEAVRFGHKRVEMFLTNYGYADANQEGDTVTDSIEVRPAAKKRKHDDSNTGSSMMQNDQVGTTDYSNVPRKRGQTHRWTFKSLLLYYAHKGDLKSLKGHIRGHVGWFNKTDYDKRTVLHVAAADGQAHIVSYLLGIIHMDLNVKDRWGNTPYMEAARFKRTDVMNVCKKYMTKEEIALVDVPKVKQLYQIARNIGQEWTLLGLELDVPNAKIDQIEMENSRAVNRIGKMLVYWRQQNNCEATFEKLYTAMQVVGIDKADACKGLTLKVL